MALPDIISVISATGQWLKDDEKKAYYSGALLGVRLGMVLAAKKLDRSWNGDLHGLASRTFMGDMRQSGMSCDDFIAGLSRGSQGVITLEPTQFPDPELMKGYDTGSRYASGIADAIEVVYTEGLRHFVGGYQYSYEDGTTKLQQWARDMEVAVAQKRASELPRNEGQLPQKER